jgi:hypothetical protein
MRRQRVVQVGFRPIIIDHKVVIEHLLKSTLISSKESLGIRIVLVIHTVLALL